MEQLKLWLAEKAVMPILTLIIGSVGTITFSDHIELIGTNKVVDQQLIAMEKVIEKLDSMDSKIYKLDKEIAIDKTTLQMHTH